MFIVLSEILWCFCVLSLIQKPWFKNCWRQIIAWFYNKYFYFWLDRYGWTTKTFIFGLNQESWFTQSRLKPGDPLMLYLHLGYKTHGLFCITNFVFLFLMLVVNVYFLLVLLNGCYCLFLLTVFIISLLSLRNAIVCFPMLKKNNKRTSWLIAIFRIICVTQSRSLRSRSWLFFAFPSIFSFHFDVYYTHAFIYYVYPSKRILLNTLPFLFHVNFRLYRLSLFS